MRGTSEAFGKFSSDVLGNFPNGFFVLAGPRKFTSPEMQEALDDIAKFS